MAGFQRKPSHFQLPSNHTAPSALCGHILHVAQLHKIGLAATTKPVSASPASALVNPQEITDLSPNRHIVGILVLLV